MHICTITIIHVSLLAYSQVYTHPLLHVSVQGIVHGDNRTMSGFDCGFIEEPPQAFQTHCPICLLVLREPFQVTCCGKSYCRLCIQRINAGGTPCPTCNEARFDSFQNEGLQQPLYGFRVFCSNNNSGCDWQGELGQLEYHLNLNPDKDWLFQGCAYTEVKCLYCNAPHLRHDIGQCVKRPFTCSLCEEYESTYTDVVTNHSPVCKCRPVECPNSCGTNNLQYQHLEEHISTQCPLSHVECEFSDPGCNAKVYRKDITSHLGENMVTHMSLLARENRKLKQQFRERERKTQGQLKLQLKTQEEIIQKLKMQGKKQEEKFHELKMQGKKKQEAILKIQEKKLEEKTQEMKMELTEQAKANGSRIPPINLHCNLLTELVKEGDTCLTEYFYIGGYKLQFEICLISIEWSVIYGSFRKRFCKCGYRCNLLESEFDNQHPFRSLHFTVQIQNSTIWIQENATTFKTVVLPSISSKFTEFYLNLFLNRKLEIHVSKIEIKTY